MEVHGSIGAGRDLALEVGLHVQQLEPEHLGADDERIGPAVAHFDRRAGARRRGSTWTIPSRALGSRRRIRPALHAIMSVGSREAPEFLGWVTFRVTLAPFYPSRLVLPLPGDGL